MDATVPGSVPPAETESLHNASAPTEQAGEGCPTPLAWQEVLTAFRTESQPWQVTHGECTITGKTFGQGPPLYLLCGMGGTHELLALFVWLLKDQFRCVLYDYPEYGRQPTLDDFAADLFAMADAQGDERFDLFATSFGTMVALRAMRIAPERVGRAVLQGGFAHRQLSWAERRAIGIYTRVPWQYRSVPLREPIQRNNHQTWFPPFDATRWQFFLENTGGIRARAMAQRGAIIRDSDLRPELAQISQPTLLVHGEGDGLAPLEDAELLQHGLPHARLEVLHTTGHIPYLTHPHRLRKVVEEFLQAAAP
ncbi:MAG TPA: alpha/beta hydrolase [Planctomycetaceae bacterium]|nr:alpha/beta hydrolase [Planctomycetaceae bacterium]